jgi:hypothetical protein
MFPRSRLILGASRFVDRALAHPFLAVPVFTLLRRLRAKLAHPFLAVPVFTLLRRLRAKLAHPFLAASFVILGLWQP